MSLKSGMGFGIGFDTGDRDFIEPQYNPNGIQPKPQPTEPVFTCSSCDFSGHPLLFVVSAGEVACPVCRIDPRTGKRLKLSLWKRLERTLKALKG